MEFGLSIKGFTNFNSALTLNREKAGFGFQACVSKNVVVELTLNFPSSNLV